MGYFNYFIKCIIRNIAYRLCKPKVLLTILAFVAILFALHSTGYCSDWTDGDIIALTEQLNGIQETLNNQSEWLVSMGVDVGTIQTDLNTIKSMINSIDNTTSNINLNLLDLVNKINTVNTTLSDLYAQQNIYYQDVTNELEEIKNVLLGVSVDSTSSLILSNYIRTEPFLRCSKYWRI